MYTKKKQQGANFDEVLIENGKLKFSFHMLFLVVVTVSILNSFVFAEGFSNFYQ